MTIGEAVARLRQDLKEVSQDSYFSDRGLYNTILTGGLMYMERERKNLHNLDIYTHETFNTEEVNLYEESCVPLDCKVCRIKVPNILSLKTGLVYKYLTSPDGSIEFKITDPTSYQRKLKLLRGNKQVAFKEGDFIYLSKCLPCVKFSYVSTDLENSSGCKALDQDVPFPDYMLDVIIKNAVQSEQLAIRKPNDNIQNKDSNS